VHSMTFAQRRNRLTTRFLERIPVVKRHLSVIGIHVSKFVLLPSPGKVSNTFSKNMFIFFNTGDLVKTFYT